jgi:translation initiation factor 1 (eIF-1/SUI1)
VIEKLALAPAELERWCKELKAALGCGGVVDGEAIVLQGDLRPRLEAVLTSAASARSRSPAEARGRRGRADLRAQEDSNL